VLCAACPFVGPYNQRPTSSSVKIVETKSPNFGDELGGWLTSPELALGDKGEKMQSKKEIEKKLKTIKGILEYLRSTNLHKDEIDYFAGVEYALEWVLDKK